MPANLIYFLYARKSSRGEDKQARSIRDQKASLRAYAATADLVLTSTLAETQSAAEPGRPVFNDMLDRIERAEANAILTWSIDRLARNFDDGSRIITMLQRGKIAEIRTPTKRFLPSDNILMLVIELGMANQYSRDLSINTKRAQERKAEEGVYPNRAKIGYLNDRKKKTILVDVKVAPVISGAFELVDAGDMTIQMIRDYLASHGVLSKKSSRYAGGNPLSPSRVTRILTDPFYYGHFIYNDQLYEGTHTPIITKSLFDRVQLQLARKWADPDHTKAKPKVFLGLLRCHDCGGAITAETQKGHIYYRCTKKSKTLPCSQPFVREEILCAELRALVTPYSFPQDYSLKLLSLVADEQSAGEKNAIAQSAPLKSELRIIDSKLEELLDMRLDGEINAATYAKRKAKILGRKKAIDEMLADISRGRKTWLEPMKDWISTATNVTKTAQTGSLSELRALARKIFGSNLVLDRRKPCGEATKPWSFIPKNPSGDTLVHVWQLARMYFQEAGVSLPQPNPSGAGEIRTRHDGQFRRAA